MLNSEPTLHVKGPGSDREEDTTPVRLPVSGLHKRPRELSNTSNSTSVSKESSLTARDSRWLEVVHFIM